MVFQSILSANSPCGLDQALGGLLSCECSALQTYLSYPSIKLTVDGNTVYTLTRENYITRRGSQCIVKIMSMQFPKTPIESRFWVMGLSFFNNYYTIFDPQRMQVGFAESKFASASLSDIKIQAPLAAFGTDLIIT